MDKRPRHARRATWRPAHLIEPRGWIDPNFFGEGKQSAVVPSLSLPEKLGRPVPWRTPVRTNDGAGRGSDENQGPGVVLDPGQEGGPCLAHLVAVEDLVPVGRCLEN